MLSWAHVMVMHAGDTGDLFREMMQGDQVPALLYWLPPDTDRNAFIDADW